METPAAANRWIAGAAVAAALSLLGAQLLVPPVAGLADNGDYQRVMGYAGFEHSTDSYAERYFSFLRTQYRFGPVGGVRSGYHSSETALALAARFASPAFWRGGLFDIRTLAAVHIALFVLALGLLLRACRDLSVAAQSVAAALSVFCFTDVGYAGPFNSFYSQTASLLFLLLTVAVAATAIRRGTLDGRLLVAYFLCGALFVGSKPQEAVQAPLVALFGLRLAGVGLRGAWRKPAAWMAAGLCLFGVVYGRRTPETLRGAALYQVVFYEILPHSPDPGADAAELGLDPEWLRYSGTDAFRSDSPLLDADFHARFLAGSGYGKVLRFYGNHPRRLVERLDRISPKIWALRPSYGNLEKSDAHPARTLTDRFALWSTLRSRYFSPHALAWLGLLYGVNAIAVAATYRRASKKGRLFREGLIAAIAMSAVAFGVCILTNAPPDYSRVFYLAEALSDLILVADAAWLTQALARRAAEPSPLLSPRQP